MRCYPITCTYVALALGALGFLLYGELFVEHPDASFAGLYPMVLTMPTGLMLLTATDGAWVDTAPGHVGGCATLLLAGLINASLLAYAERWDRRSRPHQAPPPAASPPPRGIAPEV